MLISSTDICSISLGNSECEFGWQEETNPSGGKFSVETHLPE